MFLELTPSNISLPHVGMTSWPNTIVEFEEDLRSIRRAIFVYVVRTAGTLKGYVDNVKSK